MITIIFKTLWTLILGAFDKDTKIRRSASFAGACFILTIAAAVYTAWLSYPAYAAMLNNPQAWISWAFAGFISWTMLSGTTLAGTWIAESIKSVPHIVSTNEVGIACIIILAIGGFDSYKGYTVGADQRAKDAFQTQTFSEVTEEKTKPYQSDIDFVDNQITLLYSNAQKVKYQGKWQTPYKNVRQAERLTKQREKYLVMQEKLLEEDFQANTERNAGIEELQANTEETHKYTAIFLYLIQILISIPVGAFCIDWDMRDGMRDGKYDRRNDDAKHTQNVYTQNVKSQPQASNHSITDKDNVNLNQTQNVNNGKNSKLRTCKHCAKEYVYGHARQKFCSDECRKKNWEKEKGRKLKFKKKHS